MSGLNLARRLLYDPEHRNWRESLRQEYLDDQVAFLDEITPVYLVALNALRPQVQRMIYCIGTHYGTPVGARQLSEESELPERVVVAQLSRLKEVGMVERTADGYRLHDPDLQRLHAVRWGGARRFARWKAENPDADLATIVDDFLEYLKSCEE